MSVEIGNILVNESVMCLAILVFNEARGEDIKGKQAVMEVAYNRTKHKSYPKDVCSVIKQRNQFSWYKGSQSLKPPKHENKAWDESLKVAKNFSTNKTNHTKGSLYFNHQRLGVRYGKTLKCKIGNHIFF